MEILEVLGYFTFFWLFLLSARFRAAQLQEWRDGGKLTRLHLVFEATVSFLFGVVIPIALVAEAVRHSA